MKVVILAAGYGTRLYPITIDKPKALLDIRGKKKVIDFIIKSLPKETSSIYLITNNKFYNQFEDWNNKKGSQGLNTKILNDNTNSNETRLGGIGDLMLAIKEAESDDLLIIASDNIFNFSLQEAYNHFKAKKRDMILVCDIKDKELAKSFGVLSIDSDNRITKFEEKPKNPETSLISTAIYFLKKESLNLIDEYLEEGNSREGVGYFIKWLAKNKEVYAFKAEGLWFDIGTLEAYNKVREIFRL